MTLHVLHLITGLGLGGAETSLFRLVRALQGQDIDSTIVSLLPDGALREEFCSLGVPVSDLGMTSIRSAFPVLWRFRSHVVARRPDIVQTWMYHADLVGSLGRLTGLRQPLVWNVRHTDLSGPTTRSRTRLVARACAVLSHSAPSAIVACSEESRDAHVAFGYSSSAFTVIHNGYDTTEFVPCPTSRRDVRNELGIGPEDVVVGYCSRWHPDKDVPTFLRAASIATSHDPGIRFVVWGEGLSRDNRELAEFVDTLSPHPRIHCLGTRKDVPRLMNGVDLGTLSSVTEGFPNTIAEFMACGIQCVATDVGATARVLADTGVLVRPSDPNALATAWLTMLRWPRSRRQRAAESARRHIVDNFGMSGTAKAYSELWTGVVAKDAKHKEYCPS